jgi:putative NIF3 family GTP cyclohydrolase 1 type 2
MVSGGNSLHNITKEADFSNITTKDIYYRSIHDAMTVGRESVQTFAIGHCASLIQNTQCNHL